MVFSLNCATAAAILACFAPVVCAQVPGADSARRIALPESGVVLPAVIQPVSPLPLNDDDDGISDKCGQKLESLCDPAADAMSYDTCIAAKVCEADGFCTYDELLQFANKVCSLVAMGVDKKCSLACTVSRPQIGRPVTQVSPCTACREQAFRSGGCTSARSVDAVVMRHLGKLSDGTCQAENKVRATAGDVDLDNDGLTEDCEKIVEATCDPVKEASNYDECLAANACAFSSACSPKELTVFASNYCKLIETNVKASTCKVPCSAGPKGILSCGRCALKSLLSAGCEYASMTTQTLNVKIVDAVYNKLQMGEC